MNYLKRFGIYFLIFPLIYSVSAFATPDSQLIARGEREGRSGGEQSGERSRNEYHQNYDREGGYHQEGDQSHHGSYYYHPGGGFAGGAAAGSAWESNQNQNQQPVIIQAPYDPAGQVENPYQPD